MASYDSLLDSEVDSSLKFGFSNKEWIIKYWAECRCQVRGSLFSHTLDSGLSVNSLGLNLQCRPIGPLC